MRAAAKPGPRLISTLVLCVGAWLAPACVTTNMNLGPAEVGAPATPPVGAKALLVVDASRFPLGGAIGQGAASRIAIDNDVGQILEADVVRAWPSTVVTEEDDALPRLRVSVASMDVSWPADAAVVVEARVTLDAEVLSAGGSSVFQASYTGAESSSRFFGGGTVGDEYKPILQRAYAESLAALLADRALVASIEHAALLPPPPPAEATTPPPAANVDDARPGGAARASLVVAVFDLEVHGAPIDAKRVESMSDYVATRFAELGDHQIVPRDELKTRLQAQKADSYASCYDESCQIEIGKEAAAALSLATRVSKLGTSCVITMKLFDLRRATAVGAATQRATCTEDALLEGLDLAVVRLHEALSAAPTR